MPLTFATKNMNRSQLLADIEIRKLIGALQKDSVPVHEIGAYMMLSGSMLVGTVIPQLKTRLSETADLAYQLINQEEMYGKARELSADAEASSDSSEN